MKKHIPLMVLIVMLGAYAALAVWATERKSSAIDRLTEEVATLNALIGD